MKREVIKLKNENETINVDHTFPYLEKMIEGRELTSRIYIEGIGVIEEYGEIDFESMLNNLLKSKYIVG